MTDDRLVETVARAICADLVSDWDRIERDGLDPADVVEQRWPEFSGTAQAAIAAVRQHMMDDRK